jgi:hypothetical protein
MRHAVDRDEIDPHDVPDDRDAHGCTPYDEPVERHRELMTAAIERDAEGQRALLAGDGEAARTAFLAASEGYRRSWEAAPPASYGRLIGMLKSAVLAGQGREQAAYARAAIDCVDAASPAAAYALAIAALLLGDDPAATRSAATMRGGSEAFIRTADAIAAIAAGDAEAYARGVSAIVRDFEERSEHLTGVPIADTALMLERLAAPRGITGGMQSELLPPVPSPQA